MDSRIRYHAKIIGYVYNIIDVERKDKEEEQEELELEVKKGVHSMRIDVVDEEEHRLSTIEPVLVTSALQYWPLPPS
jgi:hypothetical protein